MDDFTEPPSDPIDPQQFFSLRHPLEEQRDQNKLPLWLPVNLLHAQRHHTDISYYLHSVLLKHLYD